jgi:hypothetical protein
MGQKENERLLSADMDHQIVAEFLNQASDRGFTKKRALAAAVKLWIRLPLEMQARLLSQDQERLLRRDQEYLLRRQERLLSQDQERLLRRGQGRLLRRDSEPASVPTLFEMIDEQIKQNTPSPDRKK